MDRAEATMATLAELKALGVAVHLDDFGTGYSSLCHLQQFPIDTLKIDRSFVAGLGRDADADAITAAIISMARSLRIGVIAEGIETPEQAARLEQLGCTQVQGFLYARPLTAQKAGAMLGRPLPPRTRSALETGVG